jgi:hypothetical protein
LPKRFPVVEYAIVKRFNNYRRNRFQARMPMDPTIGKHPKIGRFL